jgi:predicted TPR repeat methyltransferase
MQTESAGKERKELYDVSRGPKYDLIAGWIGSNKKILDVGCGTGSFSARLASKGNHVVGVESSEEAVRVASKRVEVLFGDFLQIEIEENFDIVLFADVLEHMYRPELAIRKGKKIANEMIVCVPNFEFWLVKILRTCGIRKMNSGILDKNHVYFFSKKIVEDMIRANGFEIVEYESPAPKRIPRLYNHVIKTAPQFFGYQFIYRCRSRG